jgi:hypothetical protein
VRSRRSLLLAALVVAVVVGVVADAVAGVSNVGVNAAIGALGAVTLILVAKGPLKSSVRRSEDYYLQLQDPSDDGEVTGA